MLAAVREIKAEIKHGDCVNVLADYTEHMKTRLIALLVLAITITGFAGLTQETNQPARPIPIDPRAMQMQMAILKEQNRTFIGHHEQCSITGCEFAEKPLAA